MILLIQLRVLVAFNDEEESLGETQETDGVDDGEGEHVPGHHLEDHRHEGSSQLDCPTEEHQVEPGSRNAEDEKSLLQSSIFLFLFTKLQYPTRNTEDDEEGPSEEAIQEGLVRLKQWCVMALAFHSKKRHTEVNPRRIDLLPEEFLDAECERLPPKPAPSACLLGTSTS